MTKKRARPNTALQLVSGEHRVGGKPPSALRRLGRWIISFSRRHPVTTIIGILVFVNVMHSFFNIGYNTILIHDDVMTKQQQTLFWNTIPIYNAVVYPVGFLIMIAILRPLMRVHRRLLAGDAVPPEQLTAARTMLVDLPFKYICTNTLCWLPGALIFPLVLCIGGGADKWLIITVQFFCSFVVSALVTIVQLFFVLEEFLIRILYPLYFQDTRPADVPGAAPRISFTARLIMLFAAVGLMPLLAMHLVAINFATRPKEAPFAWQVFLIGTISASLIAVFMAKGLLRWMDSHRTAMEELAHGNLKVRDPQKRPDEWGKLTDHFNDMAGALENAEVMRRAFGQVVHPDVRDAIIERFHGIRGEVCDITVMFADIRGFTRRSAGQPPEVVFALLNRFLTLAVRSIEDNGGIVDKFLGDGVMALFGAPPKERDDHADVAVRVATDMLDRLGRLNDELNQQGEEPLRIGVGLHSGPAIVGCPGAMLQDARGDETMRISYTALGETVNLSQRMEQFTKKFNCPILISDQTQQRLQSEVPLTCLGEHDVPGYGGSLIVHRVEVEGF